MTSYTEILNVKVSKVCFIIVKVGGVFQLLYYYSHTTLYPDVHRTRSPKSKIV